MTEPPNDPRARIPALEERLAADPRSPMFLPLAEAYRAAGRRPDAERVLRDGLLRHPGHHSARAALGRILLESGKAEEALLVLEQAVAASPHNLLARRLLEELRRTEPPGSEETARSPASARVVPVPPSAHRQPASVRDAVAQPSSPGDELSSVTLAELYLQQGDCHQALAIYRDVREREPDNPEWLRRIRWLEGQMEPRRVSSRARRLAALHGHLARVRRARARHDSAPRSSHLH